MYEIIRGLIFTKFLGKQCTKLITESCSGSCTDTGTMSSHPSNITRSNRRKLKPIGHGPYIYFFKSITRTTRTTGPFLPILPFHPVIATCVLKGSFVNCLS